MSFSGLNCGYMTEQDRPTGINPEALTGKSNPPRMGSGGNPIMVDNDNEGARGSTTQEEQARWQAAIKENPNAAKTFIEEIASVVREQERPEIREQERQEARQEAHFKLQREGYEIADDVLARPKWSEEEIKAVDATFKRLEELVDDSIEEVRIPSGGGGESQVIKIKDPNALLRENMLDAMARDRDANAGIKPAQIYKRLKDVYRYYDIVQPDGTKKSETITTEELFVKSFQKDIGWNSVITTLLEKQADLNLDSDFVSDLNEAQKVILDIWTGKRLNGRSLKDVQELFETLINGRVGKERFSIHEYVVTYEPLKTEVIPLCIEDLGRLIMDSAAEEYRTGESHAIIDENGKFQRHNFLAWCRDRAYWYHDQFSDGEIDLFSQISVNTMYRTISLGEMINIDKYFMTKETSKMNIGAGYKTTEAYRHDEELKNLRDLALYEMWLFGMSHNFDVKYRHTMGSEQELQKAMLEIYSNNAFTKNKMRLLKILMLTGNNAKEMEWAVGQYKNGNLVKTEDQEKQGSVGKGIRRALLAYYYLNEIDNFKRIEENGKVKFVPDEKKGGTESMFEKVLGNDGVLKFYKHIIGKIGGAKELASIAEIQDINIVKEKARIILKNRGITFQDLNIFNAPKIDSYVIEDLVRDGLKKALGSNAFVYEDLKHDYPDLYKKLRDSDSSTGLLDQKEARYAVEWAFSMAYWTGINAKNDCTNVIGHDAWSKMINMKEYRLGQQKGKAAAGDYLTMFGWKKISLDFFQGTNVSIPDLGEKAGDKRNRYARDYLSKTFLEFLQGGQGNTVELDDFVPFEFKGNASRKFVEDHLMNAWQVYKWAIEGQGFNFSSMLGLDATGASVINQSEVNRLFRGFWKNLRYCYDMQDFAYGNEVRTWWKENGELKFGVKKIEETMFDDEILGLKMYNDKVEKKGKRKGERQEDDKRKLHEMGFMPKRKENGDIEKDKDGNTIYDFDHRRRIARDVFAWLLAKHIEQHVYKLSGNRKYSSVSLERIKDFFTTYPFGLEEYGDHEIKAMAFFFTNDEFKEILKLGHASLWRVMLVEDSQEATGTFFEVIGSFFKEFFKALLKN
jgi:hypothetical protein